METLQNVIFKRIENLLKENPEKAGEIDIEKIIADATPEMVNSIKLSLISSTSKMLEEHRALSEEFVAGNIRRWAEAFDFLETLIVICTESGEEFNKSYRPRAVSESDLVFDLVVRHHARACHIAQEILCLLKNGFADAAHAR